jgi:predicted RNase H-like HicB family nuclease
MLKVGRHMRGAIHRVARDMGASKIDGPLRKSGGAVMNVKVPAHMGNAIQRVAEEMGASKTEAVIALLNKGFEAPRRRRPSARKQARALPSTMMYRMITQALRRARYRQVDGGLFCATVPGLRGVIATGTSVETCRDQLAEVVEQWVLVRVARGLPVPRLGGVSVEIRQAN